MFDHPMTLSRKLRYGLVLASVSGLLGCSVHFKRSPFNDFLARDYQTAPSRSPKYREESAVPGLGGSMGAMRAHWLKEPVTTVQNAAQSEALRQEQVKELKPYRALILPLPIIATNPTQGPTVGFLPVFLYQEGRRLSTILAPRILVNENRGVVGKFEMRRFFTKSRYLRVLAGNSTRGEQDLAVNYHEDKLWQGRLRLELNALYEADLTHRFFGLGPQSEEDDESSFVYREASAEARFLLRLPYKFQIDITERFERISIGPGRLEDLPTIRARFPNTQGTDEAAAFFVQKAGLRYDSRDSTKVPTQGLLVESIATMGRTLGGQRFAYVRVDNQIIFLTPFLEDTWVFVARAALSFINGNEAPFYALPSLGGKESLRAYGQWRFRGERMAVVNVEQRVNILPMRLYNVNTVLQVAGFIDAGKVWQRGQAVSSSDAKIGAGAAVRLVVPDSEIVGSIDVGFGDEGSAVFVGLDYPF